MPRLMPPVCADSADAALEEWIAELLTMREACICGGRLLDGVSPDLELAARQSLLAEVDQQLAVARLWLREAAAAAVR